MSAIFRTTLFLAALTALFMGIGYLISGVTGMVAALFAATAVNALSYWNSDKLVLSLYRARRIDASQSPLLFDKVKRLSENAGLPMPALYVIDEMQPNAFATGRDPHHSAIAVTSGLLKTLDKRELSGVLAHELAHIKNRDTLIMTVAATIAGAVSMLANVAVLFAGSRKSGNSSSLGVVAGGLVLVLAPLAALLVQMAISRGREFEADLAGARICGAPYALADALAKLQRSAHGIPNRPAGRNPATAHLFIVNPLLGGRLDSLFSTHPKTSERIARLNRFAERAHRLDTKNHPPIRPLSRGALAHN